MSRSVLLDNVMTPLLDIVLFLFPLTLVSLKMKISANAVSPGAGIGMHIIPTSTVEAVWWFHPVFATAMRRD